MNDANSVFVTPDLAKWMVKIDESTPKQLIVFGVLLIKKGLGW